MRKTIEQLESDLSAARTDAEKVNALLLLAWRLRRQDPERCLALTEQSQGIISANAGSTDPQWKRATAENALCKGAGHVSLSLYDSAVEEITEALDCFADLEGVLTEPSFCGRARALAALTSCYRDIPGYPSLLEMAEQSVTFARLTGGKLLEANCLSNLGRCLCEAGENARATEAIRQALEICRTIEDKDSDLEASVLGRLGTALSNMGNLAEALHSHLQSLALRRTIGDVAGEARSLNSIGRIYSTLGNGEKALEFLERGLAINVALGNKNRAANALISIGHLYTEQRDYAKALECLRRSLEMKESIGQESGVCTACASIGHVLCQTNKCPEALDFLLRSLELSRKLGLKTQEMNALARLGRLYARDSDFAASIPSERFASVFGKADPADPSFWIQCVEMSLRIAEDTSNQEGVSDCHLFLAEIYKRAGDYEKAVEQAEKYDALTEKIRGEETSRTIGQLQLAFEMEQTQKESEIVRIKNQELADLNERLRREIDIRKRSEKGRRELGHLARHAGKMKSLNTMAGNVAHSFNNLLMGVLGNLEMVMDSLEADSPARRLIEEADNAANRAAELSRLMLLYAGEGRESAEAIDLSHLVEETLEHFHLAMPGKASVRCNLAQNLMAVGGGPAQIRLVILNLLTNAQEAIGDAEGVITVTTSAAECGRAFLEKTYNYEEQPEGPYVCLAVSDTGCGMDEETQEKIFDPFFTRKFTGRGLGLAAVLGIIRSHRGAISVVSKPGKGSTFRVYFPALRRPASVAALAQASVPTDWKGHGTILLIDDEEVVRSVTSRMLERTGFRVLTASGGCEGIALYRDHPDEIVCVLLDFTMPEMNGEEVLSELRKTRDNVRVIVSSGYSKENVLSNLKGKPLAGFLQKPYQLRALTEVLQAALES